MDAYRFNVHHSPRAAIGDRHQLHPNITMKIGRVPTVPVVMRRWSGPATDIVIGPPDDVAVIELAKPAVNESRTFARRGKLF